METSLEFPGGTWRLERVEIRFTLLYVFVHRVVTVFSQ